jgi:hypothetical protein
MSADLFRFWNAEKELSVFPEWKGDGSEYMRLVAPMDIDSVTEQGLLFTAKFHIYSPDACVTFQLEYQSREFPKGRPFARFEWKPKAPHNNKGLGPENLKYTLIHGTHFHPFDLNWLHSEVKVRRGELPIALPVTQNIETFKDALEFTRNLFRINNVAEIQMPPWTTKKWL